MSKSRGREGRRGRSPDESLELQHLEPRVLLAATTDLRPDLSVNVVETRMTLTASPVPGDQGTVPVVILNRGDAPAVATAEVNVFLSSDRALSSGDRMIGSRQVSLSLSPGEQVTVSVPVEIDDMSGGSRNIIAQVVPSGLGREMSTGNNVDVSTEPVMVRRAFGDVPDRAGSTVLELTNPDTGNPVRFILRGPGMATVNSSFDITITDSTPRTRVVIQPTQGEFLNVGDVTVSGGLGVFKAPRIDLLGTMSVGSGNTRLVWLDRGDGNIRLPGFVNQLRAAEVTGGASIQVDGLRSMLITGRDEAPAAAGEFHGTLLAHNTADRSTAIGVVRIAGNAVDGAIMTDTGSIGTVIVGGKLDNFGIFSPGNITTVMAGAMFDSAILAGSNAGHTSVAAGSQARLRNVVEDGSDAEEGVGFVNTVIGAGVVGSATLVDVEPDNPSGGPKETNLLPGISGEQGVFVTQHVGVVVANAVGESPQSFPETSDDPALPPDFFVRQL